MNLEEAIAAAAEIGAQSTLLTHMTHSLDHSSTCLSLPSGIALAYDGLRIRLLPSELK
jgi:phosphoribosyl 1,2-cyclic phosphate phosphodiesterase